MSARCGRAFPGSARQRWVGLALGAWALWFAPRSASAEPCGRPDLRAAFPADGASQVPLNAVLSAVYAETADYLGEPVELTSAGATVPLNVEFDPSERRLFARDAALNPETSYSLVWPALRGLSSAGHGLGRTIAFSTGTQDDREAPEFGGIRRLEWDLAQVRDPCTDDLEPRFRFDLELAEASDDGGSGSLALLLFQTRGSGTNDGAPRLLSQRELPETNRTRLELTVGEATGRVCFAAVVRDLLGQISATGSDEHCVKTTAPPFFYGCRLRAAPAGNSGIWGLAFVAASIAARRGRWRAG